jgi:hypothetical protein
VRCFAAIRIPSGLLRTLSELSRTPAELSRTASQLTLLEIRPQTKDCHSGLDLEAGFKYEILNQVQDDGCTKNRRFDRLCRCYELRGVASNHCVVDPNRFAAVKTVILEMFNPES